MKGLAIELIRCVRGPVACSHSLKHDTRAEVGGCHPALGEEKPFVPGIALARTPVQEVGEEIVQQLAMDLERKGKILT